MAPAGRVNPHYPVSGLHVGKIFLLFSALTGALFVNSSTLAQQDATAMADTIYMGGPIVTMVSEGDVAEAIAVANGKILSR